MAIGSSAPWTDHEKKVCSRERRAISSLVIEPGAVADAHAISSEEPARLVRHYSTTVGGRRHGPRSGAGRPRPSTCSTQRRIAAAERSMSDSRGPPVGDRDPHGGPSGPDRAAEPACAVALDGRDHRPRPGVAERAVRIAGRAIEADQDLVEDDLVEDPDPWCRPRGARPSAARGRSRARSGRPGRTDRATGGRRGP